MLEYATQRASMRSSERFHDPQKHERTFRCLLYAVKRLEKIEKAIEERLKRRAKRYNKDYPGQMIHCDTKRLPLLEGRRTNEKREYLFVAIDDFSRELFAAILPDKTRHSAKKFSDQVVEECAYTIEQFYTDNGGEYNELKCYPNFYNSVKPHKGIEGFTPIEKLIDYFYPEEL